MADLTIDVSSYTVDLIFRYNAGLKFRSKFGLNTPDLSWHYVYMIVYGWIY